MQMGPLFEVAVGVGEAPAQQLGLTAQGRREGHTARCPEAELPIEVKFSPGGDKITARYKHAIADYFDTAYELEHKLEIKGKQDLLVRVRSTLPDGVRCVFVTQSEARGLGHAFL